MKFIDWIHDVIDELKTSGTSLKRFCLGGSDPVRKTIPSRTKFLMLLSRSFNQQASRPLDLLVDLLVHCICGVFIGIAVMDFDYLGALPNILCDYTAIQLQFTCRGSTDFVIFINIFCVLGAMYAAIASSSRTFANEKEVYWRESSSGLSTFLYYTAKAVADIPRIFVASGLYFLSLNVFILFRSPLLRIYVIFFLLHLNSYAMGYFLTAICSRETLSIAGSGFALVWSLALSGVIPQLDFILKNYPYVAWLWNISPTRWAVESIWLIEIDYRSFQDSKPPNQPLYGFQWSHYEKALKNLIFIALFWHFMAIAFMKICDRNKKL